MDREHKYLLKLWSKEKIFLTLYSLALSILESFAAILKSNDDDGSGAVALLTLDRSGSTLSFILHMAGMRLAPGIILMVFVKHKKL